MVPDNLKALLIHVSLLAVSTISSEGSFPEESESVTGDKEVYHDPDIYLNVPQSLRRHGYSAEAHTVVTTDGYLLTIHRIPPPDNTTRLLPVFLQHGLTGNSWLWILQGPGKSLAYVLADAGYEVWLGNARGSPDSRAHTSMPPTSTRFWDFSFHEMGVYDLPTVVDYILKTSGAPQLHYVGHSMGTTMYFVMAAMKPEVATKVASSHSLAPVVFARNIRTPLRRLAKYADDVRFLSLMVGNGELVDQCRLLKFVARLGCEAFLQDEKLCTRFDFAATGGSDPGQYDPSLTPLLLAHPGNGASTKTAIHYLQLMKSGQFQQFDYGLLGNIVFYNATEPPVYNLSKVEVPTYLYYSDGDPTADTMDVQLLFEKLRCEKKEKFLVPLRKFNHMDFIVAKDANRLVYDEVLRNIESSRLVRQSERDSLNLPESESNEIQVIMV